MLLVFSNFKPNFFRKMKRPVLILSALILAVLLFRCGDDSDPPPAMPSLTLTTTSSDTVGNMLSVLDTLFIHFSGTGPAGINSATARLYIDTTLTQDFDVTLDSGAITVDENFKFYLDPIYEGEVLSVGVKITDINGDSDQDSSIFQIRSSGILSFTNRPVAGFGNANVGSFYDIISDTAYFATSVRSSVDIMRTIDLVCYFDREDKRVLGTPLSSANELAWDAQQPTPWPLDIRNYTRLYSLSSTLDFDDIRSAVQINQVLESVGNPDSSFLNVQAGQLIGFQLDTARNLRQGILRVTEITGNEDANATVIIDLKLEE